MNIYRIIVKAGRIARCLLLVSFIVIIVGCGSKIRFRDTFPLDYGGKILFLDTFSTNTLHSGYRWFDEDDPDTYNLTVKPGWLRIEAGVCQDLWEETWKRGAPLLLRPAPEGDYMVETFVSASPLGNPSQPVNTQIGLFVFQDINNWLFFGFTKHDFSTPYTTDGLMVTKTIGGISSIVTGSNVIKDYAFLLIDKRGYNFKFAWKPHQDDMWILLTTVSLVLEDHEVGMGVKTFDLDPPSATNPGQANFDFFRIMKLL